MNRPKVEIVKFGSFREFWTGSGKGIIKVNLPKLHDSLVADIADFSKARDKEEEREINERADEIIEAIVARLKKFATRAENIDLIKKFEEAKFDLTELKRMLRSNNRSDIVSAYYNIYEKDQLFDKLKAYLVETGQMELSSYPFADVWDDDTAAESTDAWKDLVEKNKESASISNLFSRGITFEEEPDIGSGFGTDESPPKEEPGFGSGIGSGTPPKEESGFGSGFGFSTPPKEESAFGMGFGEPPEVPPASRGFNKLWLLILLPFVIISLVLIIPFIVVLGYIIYRTVVLPANRRWGVGKILKNAALWPMFWRQITAY